MMGETPRDRMAAVAGMFYPAKPAEMRHMIDGWLAPGDRPPQAWRAAIVPHAGWVYSGRIAATVLSHIAFPPTVIVLCPKHRHGGAPRAVAPWQRWLFPGGLLESDQQLAKSLAARVPGLELDDTPHRAEHAIEVLLPLLAHLAPQTRIVGITIGQTDLAQCGQIASAMADVLRDRLDSVHLLISSDMNHFASDVENRRLDELALQALDRLDPDLLFATCHQHRISMCGMLPAVIVLKTLQNLHALHRAVRVDYATSAEFSGDDRQVVGYAGMLFD